MELSPDQTLMMVREPIDTAHDFFKTNQDRCKTSNESRVIQQKDNGYTFKISGNESYSLSNLPEGVNRGKVNELLYRFITQRKINKIEDDTISFFESTRPEILDTAEIDLNTWTKDSALKNLTQILFPGETDYHVGVIEDCGMKDIFVEKFQTASVPTTTVQSDSGVKYYNTHFLCKDWDEASKTTKKSYTIDIILKGDAAEDIDIFGSGISFQINPLKNIIEKYPEYSGAIPLQNLNLNNIKINTLKFVLPQALLKSGSLNLSVSNMCKSVMYPKMRSYDGNEYVDQDNFENFIRKIFINTPNHVYFGFLNKEITKIVNIFSKRENHIEHNIFFNMKRSMDAGQVLLIEWLKNNQDKYDLLVNEARDYNKKVIHSITVKKKHITSSKTLIKLLKKVPINTTNDIQIKTVQNSISGGDNSVLPKKPDDYVLFTCDRLCYLKAKLCKVSAVFVNTSLNKIKVFKGQLSTPTPPTPPFVKGHKEIFIDKVIVNKTKLESYNTNYNIKLTEFKNKLIDDLKAKDDELKNDEFINGQIKILTGFIEDLVGLPQDKKQVLDNMVNHLALQMETFLVNFHNLLELIKNDLFPKTYDGHSLGIERITNGRFTNGRFNSEKYEDFIQLLNKFPEPESSLNSKENYDKYINNLNDYPKNILTHFDNEFNDEKQSFFEKINDFDKVKDILDIPVNYVDNPPVLSLEDILHQNKAKDIYKFELAHQLPNIYFYIADCLNIPLKSLVKSVYNILSYKVNHSEIPNKSLKIYNGLDVIMELKRIYKVVLSTSRVTRGNKEEEKEKLLSLFESIIENQIKTINDGNFRMYDLLNKIEPMETAQETSATSSVYESAVSGNNDSESGDDEATSGHHMDTRSGGGPSLETQGPPSSLETRGPPPVEIPPVEIPGKRRPDTNLTPRKPPPPPGERPPSTPPTKPSPTLAWVETPPTKPTKPPGGLNVIGTSVKLGRKPPPSTQQTRQPPSSLNVKGTAATLGNRTPSTPEHSQGTLGKPTKPSIIPALGELPPHSMYEVSTSTSQPPTKPSPRPSPLLDNWMPPSRSVPQQHPPGASLPVSRTLDFTQSTLKPELNLPKSFYISDSYIEIINCIDDYLINLVWLFNLKKTEVDELINDIDNDINVVLSPLKLTSVEHTEDKIDTYTRIIEKTNADILTFVQCILNKTYEKYVQSSEVTDLDGNIKQALKIKDEIASFFIINNDIITHIQGRSDYTIVKFQTNLAEYLNDLLTNDEPIERTAGTIVHDDSKQFDAYMFDLTLAFYMDSIKKNADSKKIGDAMDIEEVQLEEKQTYEKQICEIIEYMSILNEDPILKTLICHHLKCSLNKLSCTPSDEMQAGGFTSLRDYHFKYYKPYYNLYYNNRKKSLI